MQRLNIREIAKLAGVSVATVSRSINRPEKVSPETRARILETIERLNYVPNPSAQSLSTGLTHTVACIVPTLRNEFFNQVVEGCQRVLMAAGYRLLVYSLTSAPPGQDKPDQRSVDGVVVYVSDFTSDREVQAYLQGFHVPCVIIGNPELLALERPPVSVYMEDYEGVQMALEYLYAEGNRRFGVLAAAGASFVSRRRIQATQDFFARRTDAACRLELVDYDDQLPQAMAATARLMDGDSPPTALVTFNDMMAFGAMRCLHSRGVRIPEELEIIGFDDIPLSSYVTPALSTISAPNRKLGEKAAELLLRRLTTGSDFSQCILYPVELRLRETTKNLVPPER